MAITLRPAQLTEYNLSIKTLGDSIDDVLKKIKHNKPTLYEESTRASTYLNEYFNYAPPLLSDEIINNLCKEDDIIFNTEFKEETYNNKPLFYINFSIDGTGINNKIYVFGYNPGEYNYVINKYGLYFCCNAPFFYLGIAPFTLQQYYKLINL